MNVKRYAIEEISTHKVNDEIICSTIEVVSAVFISYFSNLHFREIGSPIGSSISGAMMGIAFVDAARRIKKSVDAKKALNKDAFNDNSINIYISEEIADDMIENIKENDHESINEQNQELFEKNEQEVLEDGYYGRRI